jgi:di/tricarboxylate transporter
MMNLVVAFLCVAGILWCKFEDNLLQRIGLGLVLIGSVAEYFSPQKGADVLMSGIVVYAFGVAWKIRGRHATDKALQYPRIDPEFYRDTSGNQ